MRRRGALRAIACTCAGAALAVLTASSPASASVPGTGDLNGDGLDDLVMYGSPRLDAPPWPVRVLFGKRDNAFVDVAAPGSWGYVLEGPFGWGASIAGDVNGDGRADMLVASASPGAGGAVVVYGQSATGTVTAGGPASQFTIGAQDPQVGGSLHVFGVGDVNADGFDDLGARALSNSPDPVGPWLVYGGPHRGDVDLDRLGARGSRIRLPRRPRRWNPQDSLGAAGDVDGDGIDDLAVGLRYRGRACARATAGSGRRCRGRVWVVYGRRALPRRIDVTRLGRRGFTITNPSNRYRQLGRSVSAAGDLDGDGCDELLLGIVEGGRSNVAAVAWGSPRTRRVVLNTRTSRVHGEHVPIGDFDGDGRADLLGLPDFDLEEITRVRGFLVRGHRWAGRRGVDPRRRVDGHRLFREGAGYRLPYVAAGDVNGDGLADLSTELGGFRGPTVGTVVFGSSDRRRVSLADPGSRGFRYGWP